MDLTNFQREESNSEEVSKTFVEIETQLRRQMILRRKQLLIAGPLSFPATSMYLDSAAKLVTPFHLFLAIASAGVCWFSLKWWKGKKLGGAARLKAPGQDAQSHPGQRGMRYDMLNKKTAHKALSAA